jgi:ribosome-binding factor A
MNEAMVIHEWVPHPSFPQKPMGVRQTKVATSLHRALSEMFQSGKSIPIELYEHRLMIEGVYISPDLRHAVIAVTPWAKPAMAALDLEDDETPPDLPELLMAWTGRLRHLLSRSLALRHVPDLRFLVLPSPIMPVRSRAMDASNEAMA